MTSASDADPSTVIPILMPEAGNTMEEGIIVSWRVREGDQIELGDTLCDIETDKATMEFESPAAGRLARIVAGEGDIVPVKHPIAYLAESDAEVDALLGISAQASAESSASSQSSPRERGHRSATQTESGHFQSSADSPSVGQLPYPASPAVRRLSRLQGIDPVDRAASSPFSGCAPRRAQSIGRAGPE